MNIGGIGGSGCKAHGKSDVQGWGFEDIHSPLTG